MSADVEIILDAEDRATAKLRAAAAQLEATGKKIKDTGEATKKSTELFGQLASLLGGSEIAGVASQFAGLTEKVSGFSDVLKAGNSGALVFKAGLVGLVGVIAFQVGNALGNVIFQTEKWTKALEDANNKAKELAQLNLDSLSRQFAGDQTDIELIVDPEAKEAAYKKLFAQLDANVSGTEAKVRQQAKVVEEWGNAWFKFGERAASAQQATDELESDRERLKLLTEQREQLRAILTVEKERDAVRQANAEIARGNAFIDGLKSEIELLSAKKDAINEITAANNTYNLSQATLAQQLLEQRDALKLEQERQAALDKTIESLEKQLQVEQLGKDEAQRQEQLALARNDAERERIELLQQQIQKAQEQRTIAEQIKKTQEEAAKAEAQALDKKIADAEQEVNAMRAGMAQGSSGVGATEGRLITRGNAGSDQKKALKAAESSLAELVRIRELFESQQAAESVAFIDAGSV